MYIKLPIYLSTLYNYISRLAGAVHRENGKNNYVRSWINYLYKYGPDTLKYKSIYIFLIYIWPSLHLHPIRTYTYAYMCLHLQSTTFTLCNYIYTYCTSIFTSELYVECYCIVCANVMCRIWMISIKQRCTEPLYKDSTLVLCDLIT